MIHYYKFFCSRENLKGIRDFVNSVLHNYALSEVEINQMVTAVDEVCANLIIHAHDGNPGASIELSIRNSKEGIEFEIIDRDAVYFDLEAHETPNLQEMIQKGKKGGLGLWMVKQFMDKVEIEYKDAQSTWRLYRDIPMQTRV